MSELQDRITEIVAYAFVNSVSEHERLGPVVEAIIEATEQHYRGES